ncbi:MAG: carbohydrate porin [Acaryochloridaceae cyanobacterium SU_2_1]|nr:carbohydrate porin [Acaryochloridaceae cyanobacterium SU_2_1]
MTTGQSKTIFGTVVHKYLSQSLIGICLTTMFIAPLKAQSTQILDPPPNSCGLSSSPPPILDQAQDIRDTRSVGPPEWGELENQCKINAVWQLAQEMSDLEPSPKPKHTAQDAADFQPTTQLNGEVVFALIYANGNRPTEVSTQPSLGSRLRLDIETSFTGEDQLRFRLQSTNLARLDDLFETNMARLAIQGEDQNQIELNRLDYSFPISDRTDLFIPIVGGSISDIADPLNPAFSSSGEGALSRFGQRNPLYRQGSGAGIGISHDLSDRTNLSAGYLSNAENLLPDQNTAAFAQLTVEPTDTTKLGLLYVYAFNGLDTGTGTQQANDPFEGQSDAISSHSVGLQATTNLTSQLVLSGWLGWTRAIATDLNTPDTDILNGALTLGYLDLLGEGNQAGLIIGYPPQLLNPEEPIATSLHLELFYKIQMNKQITVTPGIVVITNPEQSQSPLTIGVIRTTFRF